MFTVGHPATITPPCAVLSPIRAAGLPAIITVDEPMRIESGGPVQVHKSPTTAAGIPPIITVGAPGGSIGPPTCGTVPFTIGQTCISFTLAANGMVCICVVSFCTTIFQLLRRTPVRTAPGRAGLYVLFNPERSRRTIHPD